MTYKNLYFCPTPPSHPPTSHHQPHTSTNSAQRCARASKSTASAALVTSALLPTESNKWWRRATCQCFTRLNNARSSLRMATAHMDKDANSSTVTKSSSNNKLLQSSKSSQLFNPSNPLANTRIFWTTASISVIKSTKRNRLYLTGRQLTTHSRECLSQSSNTWTSTKATPRDSTASNTSQTKLTSPLITISTATPPNTKTTSKRQSKASNNKRKFWCSRNCQH